MKSFNFFLGFPIQPHWLSPLILQYLLLKHSHEKRTALKAVASTERKLQTNLPLGDSLKHIHSSSSCGHFETLPPAYALYYHPPRKGAIPKDVAEQKYDCSSATAEQSASLASTVV